MNFAETANLEDVGHDQDLGHNRVPPVYTAAPQRTSSEPTALPSVPGVDLSGEVMRTFIAEGDVFTGNITAKNGIRVCGEVHGDIHCEKGTVLVQSTAYVSGSIRGTEKMFIDGRVGSADAETPVTVHTPGHLFLLDKAVVNASAEYGKLGTYGDTTLNGTMKKLPQRA